MPSIKIIAAFAVLVGAITPATAQDRPIRPVTMVYPCFVFDLQMCNRHDLKSCGATLFAAVWLRERAHVRKNAA